MTAGIRRCPPVVTKGAAMSETPTTCPQCDDLRKRQGKTQLVGKPCDICDGRGFDYLGRSCRHAPHNGSSPTPEADR